MKHKIYFLSIVLLISTMGIAQIKYEGTVSSLFKIMQLDDGSYKYVKYNKDEKVVLIYNLDQSLWRTVKLPLPKQHELDEIKHISIHSFNKDDYIELVYSCLVYKTTVNTENPDEDYLSIEFTLNIISESGESILNIPNSSEMEIIETNGKKSLFIYKHVERSLSDQNVTLVYSF